MAQSLTPEQCGRRILKVYRDNYIRAGEQLLPRMLHIALIDSGELRFEDVVAGLQWLTHNGYVDDHDTLQNGYVLTPKGYAAL